jgi:hypothetical protein
VFLIAGLNEQQRFVSAASWDFISDRGSQIVRFNPAELNFVPEEIRFVLSPEALSALVEQSDVASVFIFDQYRFDVSSSNRQITVVVWDVIADSRASDFAASINMGNNSEQSPPVVGDVWLSVTLGVKSFARIGLQGQFEDVILVEKTLDRAISIEDAGRSIKVEFSESLSRFKTSVLVGSYRFVGDFGVPLAVSHAARLGILSFAATWGTRRVLAIRMSTT